MASRVALSLSDRGVEVDALLTCPSRGISESFNFLIDSGSALSLLAWHDAASAGVDVEGLLPYRQGIVGIGGVAETKCIPEPRFVHLQTDAGESVTVELPDGILIWRPSRKRSARGAPGPAVSILGRDFMGRFGWTLVVNIARRICHFEDRLWAEQLGLGKGTGHLAPDPAPA